jgi:hypothetical protein
MDPWKELAAREECRDAVRAWAEMECTIAAMAEDAPVRRPTLRWRGALGIFAHFLAAAYECFQNFTRR